MLLVLFAGIAVTRCLNRYGCQVECCVSIGLLPIIGTIIVLQRLVYVSEVVFVVVTFFSVNSIWGAPFFNNSLSLATCFLPIVHFCRSSVFYIFNI